jgi:hypothetical protein
MRVYAIIDFFGQCDNSSILSSHVNTALPHHLDNKAVCQIFADARLSFSPLVARHEQSDIAFLRALRFGCLNLVAESGTYTPRGSIFDLKDSGGQFFGEGMQRILTVVYLVTIMLLSRQTRDAISPALSTAYGLSSTFTARPFSSCVDMSIVICFNLPALKVELMHTYYYPFVK